MNDFTSIILLRYENMGVDIKIILQCGLCPELRQFKGCCHVWAAPLQQYDWGAISVYAKMVVTHEWFHLHCVPWVCKPGCGYQNHSYICSFSRVMSVLRIKLGLIEQLFLEPCSGHNEFMQIRVVTHELFHFHSVPWVWKPGCRH